MKQVMDIHKANKKETKDIVQEAEKESKETEIINEDEESEEEDSFNDMGLKIENLCLSDQCRGFERRMGSQAPNNLALPSYC